jgi:hypothetical protein
VIVNQGETRADTLSDAKLSGSAGPILQELLNDKNYQMEQLPKETLCTMILAALGSQEEGSRKARQVFVIQDVLGPLITDGYVGLCCRTLQKLCQSDGLHAEAK